jgi:hypothetical protein
MEEEERVEREQQQQQQQQVLEHTPLVYAMAPPAGL